MRAIFSSIYVVGLFFILAGCGSADSNTGSLDSIDAGQTIKNKQYENGGTKHICRND